MSSQHRDRPRTIAQIAALVYGFGAYAIHWATFLYMMGFLIDAGVPKTIDRGASPVGGPPVLIDVAVLVAFVGAHWLMARTWFKAWWTTFVPEPVERSTYVLVSSFLLLLTFWAWQPIPPVVWSVENPAAAFAIYAIYWIGWALAIYGTFPINHWNLFGIRQVLLFFQGHPYTEPTGYDSWVYRTLPHPIFIGYAVVVWATPHMSAGHLALALVLTAFLAIDIWFTGLKHD
jgi:protein-S-isoprenylcysteine O-methyltransferase Ste14